MYFFHPSTEAVCLTLVQEAPLSTKDHRGVLPIHRGSNPEDHVCIFMTFLNHELPVGRFHFFPLCAKSIQSCLSDS